DQKLEALLRMQDGVVIEPLDPRLRRLLDVDLGLRPHLPAVRPAAGLIGNEAAAMHQADLQRGMALEHAAEYQAGRRDGGVERIADEIVEIVGAQALGGTDIDRMDEQERVELAGGGPE